MLCLTQFWFLCFCNVTVRHDSRFYLVLTHIHTRSWKKKKRAWSSIMNHLWWWIIKQTLAFIVTAQCCRRDAGLFCWGFPLIVQAVYSIPLLDKVHTDMLANAVPYSQATLSPIVHMVAPIQCGSIPKVRPVCLLARFCLAVVVQLAQLCPAAWVQLTEYTGSANLNSTKGIIGEGVWFPDTRNNRKRWWIFPYFLTEHALFIYLRGKKNAEINRKAGNVNIFLNGHKLRIDTLIMEIEWWFLSLRGTKD